MPKFEVVSDFRPAGDQPQAIDALAWGIENGLLCDILPTQLTISEIDLIVLYTVNNTQTATETIVIIQNACVIASISNITSSRDMVLGSE